MKHTSINRSDQLVTSFSRMNSLLKLCAMTTRILCREVSSGCRSCRNLNLRKRLLMTATATECVTASHREDHVMPMFIAEQRRYYAKKKKEKDVKSKKPKVELTDEDMMNVVNIARFNQQLEATLHELQQDYFRNLSLRTSTGALEQLEVEVDENLYPLNQLGQVIKKNPNLVIINLTAFPQAVKPTIAALTASGMNLNPQQEGNTIYIPIPKLTREHREGLAKSAKTMCDKAKDKMKDIQNKFVKDAKKAKEEISADLVFNTVLTIQHRMREYSEKADQLMTAKQKELLQEK